MKIELVKQTTQITGINYWFVKANGYSVAGTFTSNEEEAKKHFNDTIENAKKYPETVYETLEAVEV